MFIVSEVIKISPSELGSLGRIYLIWAILNPNGPTLYATGIKNNENGASVFYRWMHPLNGETFLCQSRDSKDITYQAIYEDLCTITDFLAQRGEQTPLSVIPSFVIASDDDETIKQIGRRLIYQNAASEDWGCEVAYSEQFGRNFFDRAGCTLRETYNKMQQRARALDDDPSDWYGGAERRITRKADDDMLEFIKARYGHIPAFSEASIPKYKSSSITDELFDRWWSIIDTPEHAVSGLGNLKLMWNGSKAMLSPDLAKTSRPIEDVFDFLTQFRLILPQGVTPTRHQ